VNHALKGVPFALISGRSYQPAGEYTTRAVASRIYKIVFSRNFNEGLRRFSGKKTENADGRCLMQMASTIIGSSLAHFKEKNHVNI
jgi:hypothetical protein